MPRSGSRLLEASFFPVKSEEDFLSKVSAGWRSFLDCGRTAIGNHDARPVRFSENDWPTSLMLDELVLKVRRQFVHRMQAEGIG